MTLNLYCLVLSNAVLYYAETECVFRRLQTTAEDSTRLMIRTVVDE